MASATIHAAWDAFAARFHALDFPRAGSAALPPRDSVRAIRIALETALTSDAFLCDLVALELANVARGVLRRSFVPFAVDRELGIRFATACWAPFRASEAHEHAGWTVTAVAHNALEVATYDRSIACDERRLVQRNLHPAPRGRAGYIYEPCVHAPRNPSAAWSYSVHVIGPHDGAPAADGRSFIGENAPRRLADDDAFTRCLVHRQRQVWLRVLASVLGENRDARVPELLGRMVALGNTRTRTHILAGIAARDPARAAALAALHRERALGPATRLHAPGEPIRMTVQIRNGSAELIAQTSLGPQVILQVDAWARRTLQFLIGRRDLVVRELPGDIDDADRVALLEALDDWGVFVAASPGQGGS